MPEEWVPFVRNVGLDYVQVTASVINPFWGEYADLLVRRTKSECMKYAINVESVFTDAYTRVNHFAHPEEYARKMWYEWFVKLLKYGKELEAKTAGSHFGIATVDSDIGRSEKEAVLLWRKLRKVARDLGYEALVFEPMSIPREYGCTIEDTLRLLDEVNAPNEGVPLKVVLDIGHAPHPDQRDPYLWMTKLASVSPIVHIQQTVLNKSNHSPFTKEFNETGIIYASKTIDTLKRAGLPDDALFCFEISHREHWDTEWKVEPDHKESVQYWKDALNAST